MVLRRKTILSKCCTDKCLWDYNVMYGKYETKQCHSIDIKQQTLTEDDCKFISTLRVHTLNLGKCSITYDGAKHLFNNCYKYVHRFALWHCTIGTEGIKVLSDNITKNNTLHTLKIVGMSFSDEESKYLSLIQHNIVGKSLKL